MATKKKTMQVMVSLTVEVEVEAGPSNKMMNAAEAEARRLLEEHLGKVEAVRVEDANAM